MICTSETVSIIGYGPWDESNEKFGEWVRTKAPGDEDTRRYSLAKGINGDRPAEGQLVTLTLHSRMKPTAYIDGDGRAQSGSKEAFRVTAFTAAKAA